jgi:PAS domain S-box/diguanylate cyclase (GGDEF) domain
MLTLSQTVMPVIDIVVVTLAIGLFVLNRQRRADVHFHGFSNAFKLMFLGIGPVVIASGADFITAFQNYLPPAIADLGQLIAPWIYPLNAVGTALLFVGLVLLISSLIPRSTRQLTELVAVREQLSASNDELVKTIADRNQELEINYLTLQQVLEDQQSSRIALLQSEKKFRTLFDKSPAIFVAVNRTARITDINLYGASVLGYDAMSLVGKPFEALVALEDTVKQQGFIERCFSNTKKNHETELRLERNNTTKIWTKVSASIIVEPEDGEYLLLVCQDISESKGLAETLSYQAKHDDLTGLHNRRSLESYLSERIAHLGKTSRPLALIYVDVDQLKVINDTCGHRAGDELLKKLVQAINESDTKFDFFARLGGDEFALVKNDTSEKEAVELAEILRNAAEDFSFQWKGQTFRQTISIGIALTSGKLHSLSDIFSAADAACYMAKEQGRNRVVVTEDASPNYISSRNEMLWVGRLQNALMRDRFELYAQPIFALNPNAGNYIHYEVLIRYVDDDGTHLAPDNFLPAAERYGLSDQIDLWVLTTILDFLDRHPEHTRKLGCCSINLSSLSLASHRSRSAIKQLVMATSFDTEKICFEITETSAIHNLDEAVEFINELKILGCRFALDDFGTGFSSFGYLKKLDVDYIKIDGSFIKDIVNDKLGRAMVIAINGIGKELGISTIAEYVENKQIEDELITLEVPYGQGFGLAKPMPLNLIQQFYESR